MPRTGGQLVVDSLLANGVSRIFGVPGESYLPILDALVDAPEIRFTVARHEGGAAMMAEAYGKLTGRPGVCLVTRGPGAANASSGVHVAAQDSTPMILLIGQISRDDTDREAFQEVDFTAVFGSQVKWAAQVNDTARLPEYMARAFSCAMSGRPGPVVLALPEDVLSASAETVSAVPSTASVAAPAPEQVAAFRDRLMAAERPLVVVGGAGWGPDDPARLVAFAERWALPVVCSFRRQDRFPNDHPNYGGDAGLGVNPALAGRIRDSDLIVALGARLSDSMTSSYTLMDSPRPRQGLVHIHADPDELGRVYQPEIAINSGISSFLQAIGTLPPPEDPAWTDWTSQINADYRKWSDAATDVPGDFNLGEAVIWLRENLPEDAVITNGAGNYSVWVHRFFRHRRPLTQLAPTSGSMGYGLPAAIAASLHSPERPVVAFAGDGCFQMTCQELGTIAENGLKIIVVVVNNGMYGTIRMHQENHYPKRVSGTDLFNPDFVALARAYGLNGEKIVRTGDFPDAMQRALASDTASVIEVIPDQRVLTPARFLDR
ncbi:thiamine pyrophosphate-binding protein [Microbaculum marinisediminis]|uniref:Thiamine pyrophosphate-binding protein n=1 Tax=Microbaculum marinisediminis TaxID=2931392 RepID=A0AAW5R370_9HYPH|nr:thiamine pyrophosphate-binding protein [Microbaculum sp. A6E488]MCT8974274.1 thiamine pyrophosphate-binding protein [Microbaculum sp. A6E488]